MASQTLDETLFELTGCLARLELLAGKIEVTLREVTRKLGEVEWRTAELSERVQCAERPWWRKISSRCRT